MAVVSASAGKVDHAYVLRLPEHGLMRLAFEFRPERANLAELTARLDVDDHAVSENWLFRWTRD